MRAVDRENQRYSDGAGNPIAMEESVMMSLLNKDRARIIDIGCGDGSIASLLRNKGHYVVGIDFSQVAVELAREKGIEAYVVDVDEGGLPFQDNSFDVIWAGDIVEHVFDPIGLLREARRIMKLDGIMLFSVPNDITLKRRLKIFLSGISPQSEIYRNHQQCKHHTVMSHELMLYFVQQAGLEAEVISGIFRIPGQVKARVVKASGIMRGFAQTFIVRALRS